MISNIFMNTKWKNYVQQLVMQSVSIYSVNTLLFTTFTCRTSLVSYWCILGILFTKCYHWFLHGHLTSLVLLVTLLSCISAAAGNAFKILHFCTKILAIYIQRSVLHAIIASYSYQLTKLYCAAYSLRCTRLTILYWSISFWRENHVEF